MDSLLTGHCLCGAVRYRAGTLLYPPTLCHCESCRRASGAHAVGWLTVRLNTLTFTAGAPAEYRSSAAVRRGFCSHCGTPLSYWHAARAEEIDLTIASLDNPAAVVPVDHVWMGDALPWDRPGDGLPQHRSGRGKGPA